MLEQLFTPFNTKPASDKKKVEKKVDVVWKGHKKVGFKLFRNDIVMDKNGMKFLIVDPVKGTMMPLDWENDKYSFTPIASASPEHADITDQYDEEDLYDITPEDRKKLIANGGHF